MSALAKLVCRIISHICKDIKNNLLFFGSRCLNIGSIQIASANHEQSPVEVKGFGLRVINQFCSFIVVIGRELSKIKAATSATVVDIFTTFPCW